MLKKQPYVWILSLDGLASADWNRMMELPNFRAYLEGAAYCRNVYSVYPSVTYPAHTSIVTGRYPYHHGVTNNTRFQPSRLGREDWNWKRKTIRGKTLYDLAYEKGMTTAAYLWPVTGGAKTLTYNMPEVFANRKWDNQVLASLRNGSLWFQAEAVMKYGKELAGIKQPELDNFLHKTFINALRTRSPQVNFVHYVDLDSTRHLYGHDSAEADAALVRHDRRLGELLQLAEEEGIADQLTMVVLGDHSSIDEHTAVYLNSLFRDQGWIHMDDRGRLISWKVMMHTCDGSAYIYVKDPGMLQLVGETLKKFSVSHDTCIEKIYSAGQAKRLGADASCSLMLEARRGYYFLDEMKEETIHEIQPDEIGKVRHLTRSTHGYSPYKKNYTTFFSMKGPGITSGEVLQSMHLIDEGPTLAHVLGGVLPEADGRLRMEFFK